jgi:hypothetical protein
MSRGDPQARRLYAWEDAVVAPLDRSLVPFERLQALVDHLWAEEGLRWPPRIRRLPGQARRTVARATRTAIEAPAELPSWVLLHEVAHALTTDVDGNSAGHGPDFVAVYLRLLVRHARLDRAMLEATLKSAGIAWTRDAAEARPAAG